MGLRAECGFGRRSLALLPIRCPVRIRSRLGRCGGQRLHRRGDLELPPRQTGADSSATSAATPHEYESNPPHVIGQNDDLPDDSLTIGRSRSNSIVLDDMLVSRRHVVITADEEGLLLRDLGSRNGTFVNGRRVEQTHLHEGDRIGIGASTFEVRDGWLVSV